MTALKSKEWHSGVSEDETSGKFQDHVLAEMGRLDDASGDWEEHIPFEAAISYFEGGELFNTYNRHVDGCAYCKEMLAAMHPTDQAKAEFELAVAWAMEGHQRPQVNERKGRLQKLKEDLKLKSGFGKAGPVTP